MKNRPKSTVATPDHTSSFPNIAIILKLLSKISSTTAEAERYFSKLERTLTSIEYIMEEQRLASLIMLQIHRSDTPSVDAVIDRFASSAARPLKFLV